LHGPQVQSFFLMFCIAQVRQVSSREVTGRLRRDRVRRVFFFPFPRSAAPYSLASFSLSPFSVPYGPSLFPFRSLLRGFARFRRLSPLTDRGPTKRARMVAPPFLSMVFPEGEPAAADPSYTPSFCIQPAEAAFFPPCVARRHPLSCVPQNFLLILPFLIAAL